MCLSRLLSSRSSRFKRLSPYSDRHQAYLLRLTLLLMVSLRRPLLSLRWPLASEHSSFSTACGCVSRLSVLKPSRKCYATIMRLVSPLFGCPRTYHYLWKAAIPTLSSYNPLRHLRNIPSYFAGRRQTSQIDPGMGYSQLACLEQLSGLLL